MKTRPWIDVSELLNPNGAEAENAVMAASLVLFTLSGQKYPGLWTTTEQYACESTGAPTGCTWDPGENAYWNPVLGSYVYIQGPSRRHLRMSAGTDIRLRGRPVQEITEVQIGGVTVDPSQYSLMNRAILRPSSFVSWGLCSGPVVTYTYGTEPPAMGKMAARKLADEFVLLFNNSDECKLPQNVTSISRQGISFEIIDPQDFLEKGKVGVYEVDLFLNAVNPSKAKLRPKVFTPDMPRPYRSS